MPPKNDTPPTFFESPLAFARWLGKNHEKAPELWVGYYKRGTGRPSLTWPESVREALRFGWIDGLRKSLDEESYKIRFTPRRPTSAWSQINIRFVEELIAEGRMEPAGLKAYEARKRPPAGGYTYEQEGGDAEARVEREVKKNRAAWDFFKAQAPWYRRTCARWVMSAKKEETRQRRLATLIADSARQQQVPPLRQLQGQKKKAGAPQQASRSRRPSRQRRPQGQNEDPPRKKQHKKK